MKKLKKNIAKSIYLKEYEKYGSIIFLIGIIVAIIASFISVETLGQNGNKIIMATLIIFGFIVGIINITNNETVTFLVSILAIVALLGPFLSILSQNLITNIEYVGRLFSYMITLLVPAGIVVAIKAIIITAKDE